MSVMVRRKYLRAVAAIGERIIGDRRCSINASKQAKTWSYRVVLVERVNNVDILAQHATEGSFLTALLNMGKSERTKPFIPLLEEVRGAVGEKVDLLGFFSGLELACIAHLMEEPRSAEQLASLTGTDSETIHQAIIRLHSSGVVLEEDGNFSIDPSNRLAEMLAGDKRFKRLLKTI